MTGMTGVQEVREPLIAPEGMDTGARDREIPQPMGERSRAGGGFDIEVLVGYILLVGVLTSMALILGGLAWHWARTGEMGIRYSISGTNFFEFLLGGLGQVFADQYRPRLLVSLGIAALMLTPLVRVLASMLYFLVAAHNWKYAAFTGFVLAVLTYSLFMR